MCLSPRRLKPAVPCGGFYGIVDACGGWCLGQMEGYVGRLILRIVINAIALWVAANFVSGFNIGGGLVGLLVVAVIFGLVNALIRPIVRLLALPLTILTLGLFTLVINALMLILVGWISGDLQISGFWPALLAGIVVSIVSTVLSWILSD